MCYPVTLAIPTTGFCANFQTDPIPGSFCADSQDYANGFARLLEAAAGELKAENIIAGFNNTCKTAGGVAKTADALDKTFVCTTYLRAAVCDPNNCFAAREPIQCCSWCQSAYAQLCVDGIADRGCVKDVTCEETSFCWNAQMKGSVSHAEKRYAVGNLVFVLAALSVLLSFSS